MPQPTLSDVHVNAPLTSMSVAFRQNSNFIADKVFPNVSVSKKSDLYYIYDRDSWNRTDAAKRAPGTESAGSGYDLSTGQYSCDVYALHKNVDDQIRDNSDSVIAPDRDAMEFVMRDLLLRKELDWASNYFSASKWTGSTTGGDVTPGTLWSAASSTPFDDLRAEILATKKATGFAANTLVLGAEVWSILADHPDLIERIKYTQVGIPGPQLLAQALGLENVYIADSIENTANEGAAESNDFVFGKNALLVHAARNPGLLVPSAGYTFSWSGFKGSNGSGVRMKKFRIEARESDRIEGQMAYDQKIIAPEMGAFMLGVVA